VVGLTLGSRRCFLDRKPMRKISTILLCFLVLAVAQAAVAGDVRKEAADRFDHGLRLFNEGDNPAPCWIQARLPNCQASVRS